MDIDTMEAGRELDAMVAEQVMGWHVQRWQDETDGGSSWVDSDGKYRAKYSISKDPRWRWSPSSDIVTAWWVLEKLIDAGVGLPSITHDGQLWVVTITDLKDHTVVCSAPTVSLAICRTALKATY